MGTKVVAGLVGLILLVVMLQSFVLGGDDGGPGGLGLMTAAPTATPPAQMPEPVLLGESAGTGGAPGAPLASGRETYTVQSGETLGSIAASLGVASEAQAAWIAEVLRLNDMADARLLQAGQELIVPVAGGNGAQQAPAPATGGPGPAGQPAATGGNSGGRTYEVESGDNPYVIADKHCVAGPAAWVNELLALNGVSANSLQVGQVLSLPTGTPARCD